MTKERVTMNLTELESITIRDQVNKVIHGLPHEVKKASSKICMYLTALAVLRCETVPDWITESTKEIVEIRIRTKLKNNDRQVTIYQFDLLVGENKSEIDLSQEEQ